MDLVDTAIDAYELKQELGPSFEPSPGAVNRFSVNCLRPAAVIPVIAAIS